jgi:methylenetetrahydrofolate dehydrogenase (NADP+) / methenyltetrahydrofolate cyclohydrolase
MKILDGKRIAKEIKEELGQEVAKLEFKPGLAAVLVGDNEASKTYLIIKEKACQKVGIAFFKYELAEETKVTPDSAKATTDKELIKLIKDLNQDDKVHGILVQLPLPNHIDTDKVIKVIDPAKDADGFLSALLPASASASQQPIVSPTHQGIVRLLEETGVNLHGKKAIILANSETFGKPLERLLKQRGIKTKTIFNFQFSPASPSEASRAIFKKQLPDYDIIISALGEPEIIKAGDIKKDVIIIDVGFNRVNGKIVGDVDFESVKDKAGFISPVPGGVGPLTVIYLLSNVITLAQNQAVS